MKQIIIITLIGISQMTNGQKIERLAYGFMDENGAKTIDGDISIHDNHLIINKDGCYRFSITSKEDLVVKYNNDTIHNEKIWSKGSIQHFGWERRNSQDEMIPLQKGDTISWNSHYTVRLNQVPYTYKIAGHFETKYKPGYKYWRWHNHHKEQWELLEWVCVYDPALDNSGLTKREKMYRWRALCNGVECWTDDMWIDEGNPSTTSRLLR